MPDAFDATVIIHAAHDGPHAAASRAALESSTSRIGSALLIPEVLIKPLRAGWGSELDTINEVLASLVILPLDEEVADVGVTLGAKYGLRAPDAIHLATAVVWGAERFFTHNTKDFGERITEIDVVVPD